MKSVSTLVTAVAAFACVVALISDVLSHNALGEESHQRRFRFTYAGAITDVPPGKTARIWLPLAQSGHAQQVKIVSTKLPGVGKTGAEKKYGNRTLYFEAAAGSDGKIPYEIVYEVLRHAITVKNLEPFEASQQEKFLAANRLVPIHKNLTGVLKIGLAERQSATAEAKKLYDGVLKHMRYDKPAGAKWGRGDTLWACDSRFGNCTDFHSLFISMCREQKIPAAFEIGFPLPADKNNGAIGGYHCWAMFAAGRTWLPVDISEADKNPQLQDYLFGNLPPGRIAFTRGRDLQLSPPQQAGPVNFLVYPYVEVDGKIHPGLEKNFSFAELTPSNP